MWAQLTRRTTQVVEKQPTMKQSGNVVCETIKGSAGCFEEKMKRLTMCLRVSVRGLPEDKEHPTKTFRSAVLNSAPICVTIQTSTARSCHLRKYCGAS